MRPGPRFRRVWTLAEATELGAGLADAIRAEFDALFSVAEEPPLDSVAEVVGVEARGDAERGASPRDVGFVREAIPERVRHEVWRRDGGRCVDCGSRKRLEFDHIIPISKGGSNTARNIELRCEACNRRNSASI